jgi:uncharacterized membrane protein HdeD (DUF308 family)
MQTYTSHPMELDRRYWRMSVSRGIVAILFGLVALFWPHLTFIILFYAFGCYAIIEGFLLMSHAFSLGRVPAGRETRRTSRITLLLEGLLSVIAGILCLILPGVIGILVVYIIAAWALVKGIDNLFQVKAHGWTTGVIGILAIILSLILFFNPLRAIRSLLWIIGLFALIAGILTVTWGMFMNLHRGHQAPPPAEPVP